MEQTRVKKRLRTQSYNSQNTFNSGVSALGHQAKRFRLYPNAQSNSRAGISNATATTTTTTTTTATTATINNANSTATNNTVLATSSIAITVANNRRKRRRRRQVRNRFGPTNMAHTATLAPMQTPISTLTSTPVSDAASMLQTCLQQILTRELVCSICQEVFIDAKVISCGHAFCAVCLTAWLQRSADCPVCRRAVNSPAPVALPVLDTFINAVYETLLPRSDWSERQQTLAERRDQQQLQQLHQQQQQQQQQQAVAGARPVSPMSRHQRARDTNANALTPRHRRDVSFSPFSASPPHYFSPLPANSHPESASSLSSLSLSLSSPSTAAGTVSSSLSMLSDLGGSSSSSRAMNSSRARRLLTDSTLSMRGSTVNTSLDWQNSINTNVSSPLSSSTARSSTSSSSSVSWISVGNERAGVVATNRRGQVVQLHQSSSPNRLRSGGLALPLTSTLTSSSTSSSSSSSSSSSP